MAIHGSAAAFAQCRQATAENVGREAPTVEVANRALPPPDRNSRRQPRTRRMHPRAFRVRRRSRRQPGASSVARHERRGARVGTISSLERRATSRPRTTPRSGDGISPGIRFQPFVETRNRGLGRPRFQRWLPSGAAGGQSTAAAGAVGGAVGGGGAPGRVLARFVRAVG